MCSFHKHQMKEVSRNFYNSGFFWQDLDTQGSPITIVTYACQRQNCIYTKQIRLEGWITINKEK
jgi:hypothetical protein